MLKKNFDTRVVIQAVMKSLLIQKGVYLNEYMDYWEKFEEIQLKNALYSKQSMKGISDNDYKHAQQILNDMEKKV